MSKRGYIKLHRQMLDWEWYSDGTTARVFLHLILTADYQTGKAVFGRRQLADALGISEKAVRVALGHLTSTGEITLQTSKSGSIATITKWPLFQAQEPQTKKAKYSPAKTAESAKPATKKPAPKYDFSVPTEEWPRS